jgi:hypothetical protein
LVRISSEDKVNLDEKSRIKVEKRIVHPILKAKFKLLESTDDDKEEEEEEEEPYDLQGHLI